MIVIAMMAPQQVGMQEDDDHLGMEQQVKILILI